MNNATMSWSVLFRLSLQNMKRWRWRILTIALLVALSFSLHVLYGYYLSDAAASGSAQTEAMETRYYDLMIVLKDEPPRSPDELPTPRFQRKLFGVGEEAVGLVVDSSIGELDLLGIQEGSAFFRIEAADIEGRLPSQPGEIALPQQVARSAQLQVGDAVQLSYNDQFLRRYLELELVGTYRDDFDLPPALVQIEDAMALQAEPQPNRYLVNYNRNTDELNDENALSFLVEWMASAYPSAMLISDVSPHLLAQSLLSRILSPGNGILLLIFVFMGIGILTVALMTFLERRREIAALKSVGVSDNQMVALLGLEYGYGAFTGILAGMLIVLVLKSQMAWLQGAAWSSLFTLAAQALANTAVVMVIALAFPLMTARVATVNQLLFARTIPLFKTRTDHMTHPEGWLVLRERQENVRILRFPLQTDQEDFICFKQPGDTVKQGEVVASMETMGGLRIWEWVAWCDGIVVEAGSSSRVFTIKPFDANASFYPYPNSLIEEEIKRNETIERGRQAARREMRMADKN